MEEFWKDSVDLLNSCITLPCMATVKPKGTPVYLSAKNGKTRKHASLTVYGKTERQVIDDIRRFYEQQESRPAEQQPLAASA